MLDGLRLNESTVIFTVDTSKYVPIVLPLAECAFIFGSHETAEVHKWLLAIINANPDEWEAFRQGFEAAPKPKRKQTRRKPKPE